MFCRIALGQSRYGKRHIGAKHIAEQMRWEIEQAWGFQEEFKLNNNWVSEFAREATRRHPVLREAFDFRGRED